MAVTAVHVRSPEPARRRRLLLRAGDDRLVARVRAGDDAAFEIIYDRYYRGLLAFCGHMLGSRHEAEDALQQSFASAYRALRGGAGDVDLRPWLYTIARNRCLSSLRAQRAQASAAVIAADEGPFEGMAAKIQQRADLRDLVEELQRLPDDQRAALVLFELGDESHEQIAAVLGVRREKVKALVFQAREALLRAREAREAPCLEIREQLATLAGRVPRRSMVRSHVDRCPGCAEFERGVRRQRAALAAILPFAPTVGLKASVMGFALGGGGAVALGGAGAGGGATVAAGGALAVGGVSGGGVGTAGAAAAGALGTAGAATVATGLATGGGAGLASLPAKGVVAKILAVMALGGGGGAQAPAHPERPRHPAASHQHARPPAPVVSAPSYPPAASRPTEPAASAANEPTAPSTSSAPTPVAPAAASSPSPSHAPAAPAPAAAPTPSGPASGATPAPADTSPTPSDAPAAAPSPAAGTAPSAPASSAGPPATTDSDGAAPPAAPPATMAVAAAPASAASTDTEATASSAAPAAVPSTAALSAAVDATP